MHELKVMMVLRNYLLILKRVVYFSESWQSKMSFSVLCWKEEMAKKILH